MVINIGIVGYGNSGKQHLAAIEQTNNISVQGIFDLNQDIDSGEFKQYISWDELLNDPKVDAIAFCIPPQKKFKLAIEAIENKKSILLEKPPCLSINELDSLLDMAKKNNVSVGVMFQHRNQIPTDIYNLNWGPETTAILEVSRPRDSKKYFSSWRKEPELSGGGILTHIGIHYLDLACNLLGTVDEIYINSIKNYINVGLDTRVVGSISYINGSTLSFTITSEAYQRKERLIIYDKDKTLQIEDGIVSLKILDEDKMIYEKVPVNILRSRVYEELNTAINNKSQPAINNLESCKGVLKILEKVRMDNV